MSVFYVYPIAWTDQRCALCIRLLSFTPVRNNAAEKYVGWFQDTGVLLFLKGYAHVILGRYIPATGMVFRCLVQPFLYVLAACFPMTWKTIPGLFEYDRGAHHLLLKDTTKDNTPNKKLLPMILFSHGLTGTGQENMALCTAWARQGYIVVNVHHADGSSCAVPTSNGSIQYYHHGPSLANYDASFRPRQVQHRSYELMAAYEFMRRPFHPRAEESKDISSHCRAILDQLQSAVDLQRAVAAGFSYGAATVARTVVRPDNPFVGAIFLDGWFHIDVQKSAGVEFEFPQEAFECVNNNKDSTQGLSVPSLFINSQQFQGYRKLYNATKRLAGTQHTRSVLPGTGHNNFCDVIFWFPTGPLQRMGVIGADADPVDAYQEIVAQTSSFLKQVVTTK